MNEPIVMNVNDQKITFNVTADAHERLINEIQPTNKVGPMHNFLNRCVDHESKEALAPFLKSPSSVLAITEHLVERFVPKLKITVGE
jgi:hypothetical protein